MRPRQFLEEATSELKILLKYNLIETRQFMIRLSFIKHRYYQKVLLRASFTTRQFV